MLAWANEIIQLMPCASCVCILAFFLLLLRKTFAKYITQSVFFFCLFVPLECNFKTNIHMLMKISENQNCYKEELIQIWT